MEVKIVFISSTDVRLIRSNRTMLAELRFKQSIPQDKQESYARLMEVLLDQAKRVRGKEHNSWQQLEYVNKRLSLNKDFPNSFQRLVTDKELTRAYIGAKLQNIRKKRKLSLRGLAHLSGIDYGNLSKIENGNVSVGLDVLCRLLQAMDIHLDFIEKIALDKVKL
ncbi:MAG: helix-turn-helix domain-containing protein [Paludibacteraceae bacterium]|nr:helix-turn-helix domain-containing protein [Paludibacteraceae bacterium]